MNVWDVCIAQRCMCIVVCYMGTATVGVCLYTLGVACFQSGQGVLVLCVVYDIEIRR